ncbi:hypothetical protein BJ973_004701 [Actinoplanes tereljensis]|nr:hypothetical protein [Actinoplanes tereljensis]
MTTPHRARTALIWFIVAAAAVPLLWLFISSAGSREFLDPTGDARRTLVAAALVAGLWAAIATTLLRPPVVALFAAVTGGLALIAATTALLPAGYAAAGSQYDLGPGFAAEAWGIAGRGAVLILPGMAIGYGVAYLTRRLTPYAERPPTGWVFAAAALLFLFVDAVGLAASPGHRLVTGPLLDWIAPA